VASKYLKAGQVFLSLPLIVEGPGCMKKPVCLGCLIPNNISELSPCPKCSWPICSTNCSKISNHSQECNLLQASSTKCQIENYTEPTNALDFILPLRMLQKLSNSPELFKNVKINYQEFKNNDRSDETRIIKFIQNTLKFEKDVDKIQHAIFLTAKYSLSLEHGCEGVHDGVESLSHSCCPNTYHAVEQNQEMVFRASVNISQGEKIYFCKTDLMKCNHFRRKQLQEMKIHCSCERCSDSTEFGTGMGGISCTKCEGGVLTGECDTADWSCGNCTNKRKHEECIKIWESLDREIKSKSKDADMNQKSVEDFERLLQKSGQLNQVPVNSQLLLDIKYRLIYIFQYHKDFYHPAEDYLARKLKYCSEWLELSEKLYKGRNYQRLLIQYERMNAAVSLMIAMKQNSKPVDEVNAFINQIVKMSYEPIAILVDEEDLSFLKAFRDLVQIATEAREEQKRRVMLNMWQDDEDEEW